MLPPVLIILWVSILFSPLVIKVWLTRRQSSHNWGWFEDYRFNFSVFIKLRIFLNGRWEFWHLNFICCLSRVSGVLWLLVAFVVFLVFWHACIPHRFLYALDVASSISSIFSAIVSSVPPSASVRRFTPPRTLAHVATWNKFTFICAIKSNFGIPFLSVLWTGSIEALFTFSSFWASGSFEFISNDHISFEMFLILVLLGCIEIIKFCLHSHWSCTDTYKNKNPDSHQQVQSLLIQKGFGCLFGYILDLEVNNGRFNIVERNGYDVMSFRNTQQ